MDLTREDGKPAKGKKRAFVDVDGDSITDMEWHSTAFKRVKRNGSVEEGFRTSYIERKTSLSHPTTTAGSSSSSNAALLKRNAAIPSRTKQHTYADLFAGGGGSTRGGVLAGLLVKYLLDLWEPAALTLRQNFPSAKVLHMSITDFLTQDTTALTGGNYVDILWVSFPCQAFSSLNRHQNEERDAGNIAISYCLEDILKKIGPRVVVMEQTNGILTQYEGQHLRAVIYALVKCGYSAEAKVLNFAEYDNVQPRKRLIIMGAW